MQSADWAGWVIEINGLIVEGLGVYRGDTLYAVNHVICVYD